MPNSARIKVFEIVPGNWTHTRTDEAWGPSRGGRKAAIQDAYKHRQPGQYVDVEFGLDMQARAKRMGVDLHAKASKRKLTTEEMPLFDPFKLSSR